MPREENLQESLQKDTVKPIEYIGGVMDEETRPLLKRYIENLNPGEAALVVFRLEKGANSSVLLESNIQQISGHDWNYVSGGNQDGPMQELVDNLSKNAEENRVANKLFSQGNAKIKAFDNHGICFGLVTKNANEEITSIKGIVHQQLNMGLNGDLVLHESDIIMNSLIDNGIFHERGRPRPIHIKTYGAGGSSHKDVAPGTMTTTEGVIDIRTHVDPLCLIDYLEKYCKTQHERTRMDTTSLNKELAYTKFYKLAEEIKAQAQDPNYTGINMVHDVANLARLAADATDHSSVKVMEKMRPEDKRYYGEITYGTPNSGIFTIHRMSDDKEGQPFEGNSGQNRLQKELQLFLQQMSIGYKKHAEELHKFMETNDVYYENQQKLSEKINRLLTHPLSQEVQVLTTEVQEAYQKCAAELSECYGMMQHLLKVYAQSHHDARIQRYCHDNINALNTQIHQLQSQRNELLETHIKDLENHDEFKFKAQALSGHLRTFYTDLIDIEKEIARKNKSIYQKINYKDADIALQNHIVSDKKMYEAFFKKEASDYEFSITASGNLFFTEHDKKAVGRYGAKTVEMENQLFLQIIHHSIANHIYIAEEHITKIAADPLEIDPFVSRELNAWANDHTMTVQDYVDAFMWANNGQSFDDFPESGRWTTAENLCKDERYSKLFYNFGGEQNPKVINPFWKEIGTDLIKEIAEGKAFLGKAFAHMDFTGALKEQKEQLQQQAKTILNAPNHPDIEKDVRLLFTNFLNLMAPMHMPTQGDDEPRFKVYARTIPVLNTGYVEGTISDWDQPIYKSTNTAVLDREAAKFVTASQGKKIGGGVAIVAAEDVSPSETIFSANVVLAKMLKAQKSGKNADMYALGREYLHSLNHDPHLNLEQDPELAQQIARIRTMVKAYQINHASSHAHGFFGRTAPRFPEILSLYDIDKNSANLGQEAIPALSRIHEEKGAVVAIKTTEELLKWATHNNITGMEGVERISMELKEHKPLFNNPNKNSTN
ncbi:coiled-coil domain-containing protein 30 [Legionella sp. 27cVA30]|uniref:Coiled-coil protein n=1 Tax=Legionella septentrionalis TaxID=2498109 RepID=A0A3S0XU21_9GAMM|nr:MULTISPECIES: hypothetical protein [Legionella]MCP0913474.1 coiled-coil domain-containing protein 30 [Legionella sp. 27cVA30]RUQ89749.1 hypothetical protein EKM59_03040 [Legionella septentrionalis]